MQWSSQFAVILRLSAMLSYPACFTKGEKLAWTCNARLQDIASERENVLQSCQCALDVVCFSTNTLKLELSSDHT